MPPTPGIDSKVTQHTKMEGMPPGYLHIPTPLPSGHFFNHNAYGKDCKHNKDFIPYLLK
jgi:hypothetical protein